MDRYNNYHKHDCISSIITPDSNTKFYEYCERAIELDEKNVFTTNHGTGGDIFEALTECDSRGLNCKSGFEGYIVVNPYEKDNRNYHVVVIPKTNVARRRMNKANSRAHKEGYYYKPRLFLEDLLNNFDSSELYITTACVSGILRDEDSINNIFYPLYEKYGNCYDAAHAQMKIAGITPSNKFEAIQTDVDNFIQEDNVLTENKIGGAIYVITELKKGRPVMVGVSETCFNGYEPDVKNHNRKTSHFVVITGLKKENGIIDFMYTDNASKHFSKSDENRLNLNLNNCRVVDGDSPAVEGVEKYEMSEVRKNPK
jgi:hypothetical protein